MRSKFQIQSRTIHNLVLSQSIKLQSNGICLINLGNNIAILDNDGCFITYPHHKIYHLHNGPIFVGKKVEGHLLTGSSDLSFVVFDIEKQVIVKRKQKAHENSLKVINEYDKIIYTGARDGKIKLWNNYQKIDEIKLSNLQNQSVTGIQFSENYILATHSNQKCIFIYDIRKTKVCLTKLDQQLCKINRIRSIYQNMHIIDPQIQLVQLFQPKNIIRMSRVLDKLIINTFNYASIYQINYLDSIQDITLMDLKLGHHTRSTFAYDSLFIGDIKGNINVFNEKKQFYRLDMAHSTQINDIIEYYGIQGIIGSVGDDRYLKIWRN